MREEIILLVEGRRAKNEPIKSALVRKGFRLNVLTTGAEALSWAEDYRPDLVIVDASSMRSNGLRISSRLRKLLGDTPIIHSRASHELEDRRAKADVYLVQPYTARKLMNRIRTLLPVDALKEQVVRAGKLTFYVARRAVEIEGKGEKRLTPKLANLLEMFLRHPYEVITRERLMKQVWKTDYFGDTRTLDVHVRWIREIIEENPAKPRLLLTVRGEGYYFVIPEPGHSSR